MVFKKGHIPWNKGLTKETDPRINGHSEATLTKMSEAKAGKNNPMYGKHHSEEHNRKISEALFGENNPMYGKTSEASPMWLGDEVSKDAGRIRARRKYSPPEGYEIHHIDGNPLNNERSNIQFVTRRQHMIIDGRMETLIKRKMLGKHNPNWKGDEASDRAKRRRVRRS